MKIQNQLRPEHLTQLEHEWDKQSVDWQLDSSSVVVEIGAYKGRWASIMCDLYGCRVYAFEPQMWALSEARKKMADCNGVAFYNYALGDKNGEFEMGSWGNDGCSLLRTDHHNTVLVQMREIKRAFYLLDLHHIDVMLVNIEGYEYTLLPYMTRIGLMPTIDNIMVQFHEFAASKEQHEAVLETINQTHLMLWNYGAVLAAWTKRPEIETT